MGQDFTPHAQGSPVGWGDWLQSLLEPPRRAEAFPTLHSPRYRCRKKALVLDGSDRQWYLFLSEAGLYGGLGPAYFCQLARSPGGEMKSVFNRLIRKQQPVFHDLL